MKPEVAELVAALPVDTEPSPSSRAALEELLTKLSHKPVPVGSLTRLWILGTLQAKIAAAYLAYWIRSSYATTDERERRLNETHLSAAIKLLGGMSYLRGAIMKLGQVMGAYPKILPVQFTELMSKLHFEAPPMHYALLREHIHNELGGDPEELFAEFDTQAFAAASLGQVHRGRLKTGERVAVKVQYPNIAETIGSDFRSMKALLTPMRLRSDWDNIRDQFDDLRVMLEMETDYVREGGFLEEGRSVFREADQVVVPRVYRDFSSRRVLTMEFLEGRHLDDFLLTEPSQELRDHQGSLIFRSSVMLCSKARLWYADPHPGNYLFMSDGRLGLIDFGCCRKFDDAEWKYMDDSMKAFYESKEAFRDILVEGLDIERREDVPEEQMRLAEQWSDWVDACLLHEGPFDFGDDDYVQQGIDLVAEVVRKRYLRNKPVNNWLFRNFVGIRAVLYRLNAQVDAKRIFDEDGWSKG